MNNEPIIPPGPLKSKKKFLGIIVTKKKIIWASIIVLVLFGIGYKVRTGKNNAGNIQTEQARNHDLKQTVLATGQVVSSTDLNLSFKSGGVVEQVDVKVGDKVKQGDALAHISQRDQVASLTSARGSLAQAQANYQKVLAGASSQEIDVAQKAVDAATVSLQNAKNNLVAVQSQQNTAVKNSFSALLNTLLAAVPAANNLGSATVSISGTYAGTDQGTYQVAIYNTGIGPRFQVSGLEIGDGDVRTTPVPLGKRGLYIQFSGTVSGSDSWTVSIPNTLSSTYNSNYNNYQAALQTQASTIQAAQAQINNAQTGLDQAQAQLELKRAQARPADLGVANAQILSAQGQVQAALSNFENTIIRAPADGTITQVDIKVGEQATPSKEAMILQDIGSLHVEANISEANIASVQSGQAVDFTFDALGPDRHFTGIVQTVNPASTLVSGVVNYKVTASVNNVPEIKPGMTANMTVLIAKKDNVLAMPLRGIISRDGKKIVRVITDSKKKTYTEVEVKTGLEADGGLVEITSGLAAGQEVVTFIKK